MLKVAIKFEISVLLKVAVMFQISVFLKVTVKLGISISIAVIGFFHIRDFDTGKVFNFHAVREIEGIIPAQFHDRWIDVGFVNKRPGDRYYIHAVFDISGSPSVIGGEVEQQLIKRDRKTGLGVNICHRDLIHTRYLTCLQLGQVYKKLFFAVAYRQNSIDYDFTVSIIVGIAIACSVVTISSGIVPVRRIIVTANQSRI